MVQAQICGKRNPGSWQKEEEGGSAVALIHDTSNLLLEHAGTEDEQVPSRSTDDVKAEEKQITIDLIGCTNENYLNFKTLPSMQPKNVTVGSRHCSSCAVSRTHRIRKQRKYLRLDSSSARIVNFVVFYSPGFGCVASRATGAGKKRSRRVVPRTDTHTTTLIPLPQFTNAMQSTARGFEKQLARGFIEGKAQKTPRKPNRLRANMPTQSRWISNSMSAYPQRSSLPPPHPKYMRAATKRNRRQNKTLGLTTLSVRRVPGPAKAGQR